jgi:hypothetical protein
MGIHDFPQGCGEIIHTFHRLFGVENRGIIAVLGDF